MNATATRTLLDALIAPATVALIGASASEGKLTARPLSFMRLHGYEGRIYPVNPVRDEVMGLKAYPSVMSIPEKVEHAYILLGTDGVLAAMEDCAAAGVKIVSVLADGFAESGPDGTERQARLVVIAKEAGMLLIGPNSTGLVATAAGFSCTTNAAFRIDTLPKGRLAVLSQSGSLIGTIQSRGQAMGAGFSTLISVGNEAGAGIGELGQVLLDDPGTDGFLLFMETIRNPDALTEFARGAAKLGKPVTAYLIGRSDEGQALSVSHTGAMTGSSVAVSAFLRQIGIREVENFETLIEAPRALSMVRLSPNRPRAVTVISTTGGGGAMVVDQISARGVAISGCSDSSRKHLEAQAITLGHGKLIDVTLAGTQYDIMKEVVSTLLTDPETGLLLVVIGSSAQFQPELAVKPIVDAVAEAGPDAAPVMAFPLPHAPESLAMLAAGGVPSFRNVETCAETISLFMRPLVLAAESDFALPRGVIELIATAPSGVMDEVDAGEIFGALGVQRPAQMVLAPGQPTPEMLPFAFPVVAKLISSDLPHKTEAGAIRIGLKNQQELSDAIDGMLSSANAHAPGFALKGILVQEMRGGLGEALVGIARDPLVGPVITVGMGGILTEIYRDVSVRPAPVSVETATEMLMEVKGFAVMRGFRGKPLGDMAALARAVSDISMISLCEGVEEAEINPILIGGKGEGVVLLDALIRKR